MDMKKFLIDLERLVNIDCGSNVPEGVQEVTEIFKKELEGKDEGVTLSVEKIPF